MVDNHDNANDGTNTDNNDNGNNEKKNNNETNDSNNENSEDIEQLKSQIRSLQDELQKQLSKEDSQNFNELVEKLEEFNAKDDAKYTTKIKEIKESLKQNMEALKQMSKLPENVRDKFDETLDKFNKFFNTVAIIDKNKSKEKTIVTVFFTDTNDDKKILSRTTEIYKNEISSISDIISMLSNTIEDVELGLKAIHRGARNEKKNLTTNKFSRNITSDGKITAEDDKSPKTQTVFDGTNDLVAMGKLSEDNTDYSKAIKILNGEK
jgi:phage-related protein